jgi:3,4-dihydroxy-9,10-secoandrosta-1,3,5(10)-triene-9,17-dione 4,5-dioxygenase
VVEISGLSYVVVEATDPAAWRTLGENVIGMMASETADGLALKMDDRDHRILVTRGNDNRYAATGWEVGGAEAFDAVLDRLTQNDIPFYLATPTEAAARKVQQLACFDDPSGNRQELVWGFRSGFSRFTSPQGVGRFVTGPLGMGHTVLPAHRFDETEAFYRDILGFGLADILVHRPPGGPAQRIHFFHCGNSRHHSLALFEGHVPAGCVHLMVEVESMDEVGRALDRVKASGTKLMCTLGRHVNDEMISFYFATPAGFAIEFGYGGRVIDWPSHVAFESTAVSLWGHDFSVGFG